MATRSSVLAWGIPWTEGPGGLQSVQLQSCTQLNDCHLDSEGAATPPGTCTSQSGPTTQHTHHLAALQLSAAVTSRGLHCPSSLPVIVKLVLCTRAPSGKGPNRLEKPGVLPPVCWQRVLQQPPAWETRVAGAGYLLHDEPGQDVHDEAPQAGVHSQGLNDGPHEQHGQWALLHQLLHHHGQHLRRVHVPLRKAQVGGCEEAERAPVPFAQQPLGSGSPTTP